MKSWVHIARNICKISQIIVICHDTVRHTRQMNINWCDSDVNDDRREYWAQDSLWSFIWCSRHWFSIRDEVRVHNFFFKLCSVADSLVLVSWQFTTLTRILITCDARRSMSIASRNAMSTDCKMNTCCLSWCKILESWDISISCNDTMTRRLVRKSWRWLSVFC